MATAASQAPVAGPVAKVDAPCPHCGAADSTLLWTGREHEYTNTTDEPFSFVRCTTCRLVRLDPRPDVSELGRIYPPDYYAYGLISDTPAHRPRATDRAKIRMYQQRITQQVARLGGSGRVRLLDVGCADGRLLDWYAASEVGPRLEIHGIELSEDAAAIARGRGHHVIGGRFEVERELERGSFDLIIASHVVEHVDDPLGFTRHAADLLAPGGLLVLATPNWDSADARRFRGRWGGNHFPRHWTLYDEHTIGDLAMRVGLRREHVEYQVNPVFWVWTCHSALRARFPRRRWPDQVFPTVDIFHPGLRSFVLLSAFTAADLLQRAVTGRTASMSVDLRKP